MMEHETMPSVTDTLIKPSSHPGAPALSSDDTTARSQNVRSIHLSHRRALLDYARTLDCSAESA
ncbi:hypothetical protein NJLHNGOC_04500 [Novacetimonas cocois]|uniref:Uncharacterized protein n=2 Tax=Novacetimonas cocois TaxID=1747507 RepID=A0A365YZB3_9PROT|nr:hypothetical protein NJLHNGOC_04500 [Novacetimonas cocois]